MGHVGNKVGQPVGRWEGEKVKRKVPSVLRRWSSVHWTSGELFLSPYALGKRRRASPARRAWQGVATVPLAVSALTHSIERGEDGRAAGPSGSDTLRCCGGRRQERSSEDSGRTHRDPQEGGRSGIRSTAAFPSLICSKWERLVQLLDVISQGPGCGGQEGFFIQKEMSIWTWVGLHRSRNQFPRSHLPPFALPQKKWEKLRNPFLKGNMFITC